MTQALLPYRIKRRVCVFLSIPWLASLLFNGILPLFPFNLTTPGWADPSHATERETHDPVGSLSIASHPDGATVVIDGRERGHTPITLENVPVGSMVVRLEKPGYPTRREIVPIKPGEKAQLHLLLMEHAPGVLHLSSTPDQAIWWMDGTLMGATPQQFEKIPTGTHQLLLRKPGYEEWSGEFEARKGQLTQLHLTLVAKEYALTVVTEPKEAKIQFLNNKKPYHPGIQLPPGNYVLWISAPGYEPKKGHVILVDKDWIGHVRLKKNKESQTSTVQPLRPPPVAYDHPAPPAHSVKKQEEDNSTCLFCDLPHTPAHSVKRQEKNNTSVAQAPAPVQKPIPEKPLAGAPLPKKNAPPLPVLRRPQEPLEDLLLQAQRDIASARLLTPSGNNAQEKYLRILSRHPRNQSAQEGLKQVRLLTKTGYLILVRIFPVSETQKAERYLSLLADLDLPAFLVPTTVKETPYLRVCAGLFPNRDQAMEAVHKITRILGLKDIILNRYRPSLYKQ